MEQIGRLSHTKWECKYHVVWIPKCRRKVIFGDLRKYLGDVLKKLAQQKECEVHDGHLMKDHVQLHPVVPQKCLDCVQVNS